MDWIVAITIALVGAGFALSGSSWAVDYAIVVFVFNRGLRRYIDWNAGAFNPLSPISLTPLVVAGLMFIPFLARAGQLSPRLRMIFLCFGAALGYAFLIGLLRVRFAAVYALAEFLAPVAMFGFAATLRVGNAVRDRWVRTMAWCAVGASVYGWWQYLTIPPWDAFWVRAVGFEGYLGILEPTKMAVFSTMHERGPLAGYLGLASVAMIVSPRWRTFLSWPAVFLVLSCELLTLSRSGIIFAGIGVLSFILVNHGAALNRAVIALLLGALLARFGFERLPGSENIKLRYGTLTAMQRDGSLQGRLDIYGGSMGTVLAHPLGFGLGASGYSTRINSGGMQSESIIGDAGYSELILTFGWFGAAAFVSALVLIWREMSFRYAMGIRDDGLLLGRALMLGLVPMFFVGNMLSGISLFWLSFGYALAPLPRMRRRKPAFDGHPPDVGLLPSPSAESGSP